MVETVELLNIDSYLIKEYGESTQKEFRRILKKEGIKIESGQTYSRVSWSLIYQLSKLGYDKLADCITGWSNYVQATLVSLRPNLVKWS